MAKKLTPQRTEKPYTPWRVTLGKTETGTRRVRKFFKTESEALEFIARLRAVGWQCASTPEPEQGMLLAEVVAAFAHGKAHLGKPSQAHLRCIGGRLLKALGHRPIASVTHQEIGAWLQTIGPGYNRWNHYKVARRIFQYAVDWLEVLARNPFRKIPTPAKTPDGGPAKIAILTPEQFAEALAIADTLPEPTRSRCLAILALGGLAGLRGAEISGACWEDISDGEVFVRRPKRVRGWQPRYVKTGSRFATVWLEFDPSQIRRERQKLMLALGWDGWPRNCLRHSFGTYHLAHFKNLAETRTEMGHESENITRQHYAIAARAVDAAAWWDIACPTEGQKKSENNC